VTDKKHHTKLPHAVITRALDKQGFTRAVALNSILSNRSVFYCKDILTGDALPKPRDISKLSDVLGIDREDLV